MILEKFLGNSLKKVTTVGESGEIPHFCYLGYFWYFWYLDIRSRNCRVRSGQKWTLCDDKNSRLGLVQGLIMFQIFFCKCIFLFKSNDLILICFRLLNTNSFLYCFIRYIISCPTYFILFYPLYNLMSNIFLSNHFINCFPVGNHCSWSWGLFEKIETWLFGLSSTP